MTAQPLPPAHPDSPAQPAPPGSAAQPPTRPPKAPLSRVEKLLAAILGALVALVAAAVALILVVHTGLAEPTAPTRHVVATVSAVNLTGRAVLGSPTPVESTTFRPALEGGPNEKKWELDLAFRESVTVELSISASADVPLMRCSLTAEDGTVLAAAELGDPSDIASCRWTNNG